MEEKDRTAMGLRHFKSGCNFRDLECVTF